MCDRPNELAVCCALAQNRVHQNILSFTQSRCVAVCFVRPFIFIFYFPASLVDPHCTLHLFTATL